MDQEGKKNHVVSLVGHIKFDNLPNDRNGVVQVVLLDDFQDKYRVNFIQCNFLYVNESHLIFSVRCLDCDFLHFFHTVMNVINVHLDNVVDG